MLMVGDAIRIYKPVCPPSGTDYPARPVPHSVRYGRQGSPPDVRPRPPSLTSCGPCRPLPISVWRWSAPTARRAPYRTPVRRVLRRANLSFLCRSTPVGMEGCAGLSGRGWRLRRLVPTSCRVCMTERFRNGMEKITASVRLEAVPGDDFVLFGKTKGLGRGRLHKATCSTAWSFQSRAGLPHKNSTYHHAGRKRGAAASRTPDQDMHKVLHEAVEPGQSDGGRMSVTPSGPRTLLTNPCVRPGHRPYMAVRQPSPGGLHQPVAGWSGDLGSLDAGPAGQVRTSGATGKST